MRKFIAQAILASLIAFVCGAGLTLAVTCSNVFPSALNNYAPGSCIPSAWANALEAAIGVTGSASTTSLTYQANHLPLNTAYPATTSSILLYGSGAWATSTPVYNVAAFGTNGAAVKAAIAAAPNGSVVYVPPGTYTFGASDTTNFGGKSIKLIGARASSTFFVASGVTGGILYDYYGAATTSNYRDSDEISGITFNLNNATSVSAISMPSSQNIKIHDNVIENGNGIYLMAVGYVGGTLGSETSSTASSSASRNIQIYNNTFTNNAMTSYEALNCTNCWDSQIHNNYFVNNSGNAGGSAAMTLYGYDQNVAVDSNIFDNNNVHDQAYFQETTNASFSNNKIYFPTTVDALYGFVFINSQYLQVNNNLFNGFVVASSNNTGDIPVAGYDIPSTFDSHASFYDNSNHITIEDNTMLNDYSAIIIPNFNDSGAGWGNAQTDIIIRDNQITTSLFVPIAIAYAGNATGMKNITITGNTISTTTANSNFGAITVIGSSTNPSVVSNVFIANNTIGPFSGGGTNAAGIYVSGASNVTMSGNYVKGTGIGGPDVNVGSSTGVFYSSIDYTGTFFTGGDIASSTLRLGTAATYLTGCQEVYDHTNSSTLWYSYPNNGVWINTTTNPGFCQ